MLKIGIGTLGDFFSDPSSGFYTISSMHIFTQKGSFSTFSFTPGSRLMLLNIQCLKEALCGHREVFYLLCSSISLRLTLCASEWSFLSIPALPPHGSHSLPCIVVACPGQDFLPSSSSRRPLVILVQDSGPGTVFCIYQGRGSFFNLSLISNRILPVQLGTTRFVAFVQVVLQGFVPYGRWAGQYCVPSLQCALLCSQRWVSTSFTIPPIFLMSTWQTSMEKSLEICSNSP